MPGAVNRGRVVPVSRHMNRYALRLALPAVAVSLALIVAGCSSSKSSSTSTPPANSTTSSSSSTSSGGITISGFSYSGELTVKAGATITVTNKDSVPHTLTDKANHKFDSGTVNGSGGTATFTAPSAPGTYNFGCTFHPSMAGKLVVTS
jgi:plastocyanin